MADVFVRFRVGRSYVSDVWAVLLDDLPVNLGTDGWAARVVTAGDPPRVWLSDPTEPVLGSVQLGRADVELDGATVETSTVQIVHGPGFTDGWPPFVADFEVIIEKSGTRHTVLSGFMRGDDVLTDDSPERLILGPAP